LGVGGWEVGVWGFGVWGVGVGRLGFKDLWAARLHPSVNSCQGPMPKLNTKDQCLN
jgi:hypothetical protein